MNDIEKQACQLGCSYASTQQTVCAVCGQYKHTPLRNDEMGGYVCLTCIDRELERLQLAGGGEPEASKAPEPSMLASAMCSLAEERTISDLLASSLIGEYPAEDALKRYCAGLSSRYNASVVMAKFKSKQANGQKLSHREDKA